MSEPLPESEVSAALERLPDWVFADGALHAAFAAPSSRVALRLVAAIGEAAEAADHHPDLQWAYDQVVLRLTSHDAGDTVTRRDLALAGRISAAAAALEVRVTG